MKKKIAMIVDADNWAFANIARNVSNNLKQYYDFKLSLFELQIANWQPTSFPKQQLL